MTDLFYLTTYRKHYVPKPIKLVHQVHAEQEFKDPISAGHRSFLFINKLDLKPPEEDVKDFFTRSVGKCKVEGELDVDVILKYKLNAEGTSEYQHKYCPREEESILGKKKKFTLPEDIDIPLTTQRISFKHPLEYSEKVYEKVKVIKPQDNMEEHNRMNAIFKGKYQDSEYMATYCVLGENIIKAGKKKHDHDRGVE